MTLARRSWGYLQLIIFFVALCAGCAEQPPTEAVSQAEKAVADAQTQEANLYAQESYLKAEEALKKTRAFMTDRKFGEAKPAADEAAKFAREAASQVEAGRAKMKSDADRMVTEIQAGLAEFKNRITTAARSGVPLNLEETRAVVGKMEVDLINARVKLETVKLRQAHDELSAIKKELEARRIALPPPAAGKI
jgi:hypothetical protein